MDVGTRVISLTSLVTLWVLVMNIKGRTETTSSKSGIKHSSPALTGRLVIIHDDRILWRTIWVTKAFDAKYSNSQDIFTAYVWLIKLFYQSCHGWMNSHEIEVCKKWHWLLRRRENLVTYSSLHILHILLTHWVGVSNWPDLPRLDSKWKLWKVLSWPKRIYLLTDPNSLDMMFGEGEHFFGVENFHFLANFYLTSAKKTFV